MHRLALALVLGSLALVTGCPAQPEAPQFDTGPSAHDAALVDAHAATDGGVDASSVDDAGMDAAAADDAGMDAAAAVDTGTDAATFDAATSDAGHDAATDTNPTPCVAAGGMCVPLVPSACAGGTVGSESCGGGLGVECCHPGAASAAPVCMFTGTSTEGWYQPDGTLLCVISCAGLTAMCQRVGTPSQGWYTTSGHGCPPHSQEILSDHACVP